MIFPEDKIKLLSAMISDFNEFVDYSEGSLTALKSCIETIVEYEEPKE